MSPSLQNQNAKVFSFMTLFESLLFRSILLLTLPNVSDNKMVYCFPLTTVHALGKNRASLRSRQRMHMADDLSIENSDRRTILVHFCSCLGFASLLSTYEDFDCTSLKPNRGSLRNMGIYARRNIPTKADFSTEFPLSNSDTVNIISTWKNQVGAATGGMGANQLDRTHVRAMKGEKTAFSARDEDSITIPSYNEIMEQHRKNNVLRWRKQYREKKKLVTALPSSIEEEEVRNAATVIFQCLITIVREIKPAAQDYDWEKVKSYLASNLFRTDMEMASSTLFYSPYVNSQNEIGHDWGSCAWRHTCGALADIQEALAELNNSLGMLEPNECIFCLDIAERGLRSIISTIPFIYRPELEVPPYASYVSSNKIDYVVDVEAEGSENAFDQEFLRVLNELRSDSSEP